MMLLGFVGAARADSVCGGGGGDYRKDATPGDAAVDGDGATALRAPRRSLRAYGGGLVFAAALGGIWVAARRNQDGDGDGDRAG